MFRPEDIYMYKEDLEKHIMRQETAGPTIIYKNYDQLSNIDNRYGRGKYNGVSLFGRRVEESTMEIARFIKDIDRSIKDNNERMKKFAGTVNGAKYEVELRNITASLFNTKLAAIKTKVDFSAKRDKAEKEDYKLMLDSGNISGNAMSNSVGSNESFISGIINGGVNKPKYNYSSNINLANVSPMKIPTNSAAIENYPDERRTMEEQTLPRNVNEFNQTQTLVQPTVETQAFPEFVQPNNIMQPPQPSADMVAPTAPAPIEPVAQPNVEETPENVEANRVEPPTVQLGATIVNANGETVPVFSEGGLEDFIDDPSSDQNVQLAYNNIIAGGNPKIKTFFKYNKEENLGYLIQINEDTGEELPDVTTLPLDLIYPWNIDFNNNIISTAVREEFPVIFTHDPVPQKVKDEMAIILARESSLNDEEEE